MNLTKDRPFLEKICTNNSSEADKSVKKHPLRDYSCKIVKRYVDIRPDANNIIQDIINEVLKKMIGTECTNLGYCVSSDILKNSKNSKTNNILMQQGQE